MNSIESKGRVKKTAYMAVFPRVKRANLLNAKGLIAEGIEPGYDRLYPRYPKKTHLSEKGWHARKVGMFWRIVGMSAVLSTVSSAVFGGPVDVLGDSSRAVPRKEQLQSANEWARKEYDKLTLQEQYELMFLYPQEHYVQGEEGGVWLADMDIVDTGNNSNLQVRFGQACIGAAYDTRRSQFTDYNGDRATSSSPAAAFNYDSVTGLATVAPVAAEGDVLTFYAEPGKPLIPDKATADNLMAAGCAPSYLVAAEIDGEYVTVDQVR